MAPNDLTVIMNRFQATHQLTDRTSHVRERGNKGLQVQVNKPIAGPLVGNTLVLPTGNGKLIWSVHKVNYLCNHCCIQRSFIPGSLHVPRSASKLYTSIILRCRPKPMYFTVN